MIKEGDLELMSQSVRAFQDQTGTKHNYKRSLRSSNWDTGNQ